MTKTYNVDAGDGLRDQLPSEVAVESQAELTSTVNEMQKKIGPNARLSVDEDSKTIHAMEFMVN